VWEAIESGNFLNTRRADGLLCPHPEAPGARPGACSVADRPRLAATSCRPTAQLSMLSHRNATATDALWFIESVWKSSIDTTLRLAGGPMNSNVPSRENDRFSRLATPAMILAIVIHAPNGYGAESTPSSHAVISLAPLAAERQAVVVPQSFLGFSQEWPWVASMTLSDQCTAILRHLHNDNGPLILRVGGATYDAHYDRVMHGTDSMDRRARDGVEKMMDALEALHDRLGMKFIITLSLATRDLSLIKRQAEECRGRLGDSIIAFELGNEPNYYKDLRRDLWRDDGKGSFYKELITAFTKAAEAIAPEPCAGPAWGWIGLKPALLEQYLKATPQRLAFATVHYYHSAYFKTPPTGRMNDTPETLLDDTHTREIMATWVGPQVAMARKYGVPLRISESNSISGGGNTGVSDVHAAALWSLDTMLEMAAAGVAGIDFHQASPKYALYERVTQGTPGATGDAPPLYHSFRVQPPFYGMLFFQRAVTAGSRISKIAHDGPPTLKAYQVCAGEESRTVLVNKSPEIPIVTEMWLPAAEGTTANVVRLAAPGNSITARSGITISGVSYDAWGGEPSGEPQRESLTSEAGGSGRDRTFRIELSPASAAVVTVLLPNRTP
jgi:hypothetical protein